MEVKEVFSLSPPICEFQWVALKGASQNRAFSFLSDSNTNDVAVPHGDKMRKKLDL
jgi:hypothetical protein